MKARIKKGDMVQVIAGDDKGKSGKVLQVLSGGGRALVEGLNFVKKHMRKTQDNPQGGVFEKEAPIHLSNLKKAE
ncbi:MAG: 50S ribosomal protein L24 [Verrucomicrobia bacterium]|nr:50S ribosomal protein L24 [Verrucomicrobiota bacterium]